MLSEIFVLPKPREKSGRKRKAAVNQKAVCLTDDSVLDHLKTDDEKKKEDTLRKLEKRRFREEKRAAKERSKREREEKKKQKEVDKYTKEAANLEVETMLDGLTLEESDVDSDDAVCPKCGLAYSVDEGNLWVCCDKCSKWYDFKCTKLKSKRHIPGTFFCDLCK